MSAAESLGQLTVINLTVSFIFAIACYRAWLIAWCFANFPASTGRLIFSFVKELSRCQMFGRVQGGQRWWQEDRRSQG